MIRRMLINAQNPEELRIAILKGSTLENFQVEVSERGLTRGNVYRGIITNVQPSLNAAFVDYGAERDGFLPMPEIVEEAYHRKTDGRAHVEKAMERGKPVIVQVTKEPEEQKGAALTTSVSLAGRYFVFTPFDDTRGVSRKVEDEEARARLKEQSSTLKIPKGAGYIIRTNALDQTKTTLARDLSELVRAWKSVEADGKKGKGPALLLSDQDIILRALRDYLDSSIEEVLIDDDTAFSKAEQMVATYMPRSKVKLVRYAERQPLFSRFGVDSQVDRIYERSVGLPSGGSIVIDRTEALWAIDVNSGKSTRAATQSETAVNTNLEAAAEVARQLRLRDIGGLIVVDFIDMRGPKHNRLVEKAVRDAMATDKARSTVGKISDNGLLEINRQRIQQALHLRTHRPCPTCEGTGRIASPEMVGLNLLRRIEARATTTTLKKVRIALHPELADAFQNGRRQEIASLEREFGIHVEVIASPRLHRPEQEIEWMVADAKDVQPAPAVAKLPPPLREKTVGGDEAHAEQHRVEGERLEGEKRKRRRRGRTNRNGHHAELQFDGAYSDDESRETSQKEASDVEQVSSESTPEAHSPQPSEHPAPHARKRRRRGRRSSGAHEEHAHQPPVASGENGAETAEPPIEWLFEPRAASEPPQAPATSDVEMTEAPVESAEQQKAHRRRRGRRRGASHENRPHAASPAMSHIVEPGTGFPDGAALESAEKSGNVEAGTPAGEGEPKKPRRRRGRRRGGRKGEPESGGDGREPAEPAE